MSWLILDTSTPVAVVGLVDLQDDGCVVIDEVVLEESRRHAERLPETVMGLLDGLRDGPLPARALSGIGVGVGPGSFIGIRTGLAFAKGLARARGVPLVGLSTLAALVASEDFSAGSRVVAFVDARRGECYAQTFMVHAGERGVHAIDDATAVKPDDPRLLATSEQQVVGAGVGSGTPVSFVRAGPSARGLGRILAGIVASGALVDERATLVPVYARAPDAKLPALDPSRGLAALHSLLKA